MARRGKKVGIIGKKARHLGPRPTKKTIARKKRKTRNVPVSLAREGSFPGSVFMVQGIEVLRWKRPDKAKAGNLFRRAESTLARSILEEKERMDHPNTPPAQREVIRQKLLQWQEYLQDLKGWIERT